MLHGRCKNRWVVNSCILLMMFASRNLFLFLDGMWFWERVRSPFPQDAFFLLIDLPRSSHWVVSARTGLYIESISIEETKSILTFSGDVRAEVSDGDQMLGGIHTKPMMWPLPTNWGKVKSILHIWVCIRSWSEFGKNVSLFGRLFFQWIDPLAQASSAGWGSPLTSQASCWMAVDHCLGQMVKGRGWRAGTATREF